MPLELRRGDVVWIDLAACAVLAGAATTVPPGPQRLPVRAPMRLDVVRSDSGWQLDIDIALAHGVARVEYCGVIAGETVDPAPRMLAAAPSLR
jgi:hypothetical protein